MTGLLVSVANISEAKIAIDAGVDILDMKNPAEGALGRLKLQTITEITAICRGKCTTSATIGDLPMQAELLASETEKVIETGVDIVKVGFFGIDQHEACATAIGQAARDRVKLIAVMMADQSPNFSLISILKAAGFYGVMLDTANKDGQCLLDHQSMKELNTFCRMAEAYEMVTGLAGSLSASHIQELVSIGPDYLGFRGAVCHQSSRDADLEQGRVSLIKELLYIYNTLAQQFAIC
ncbi:MAG: (5-formylfuran-3-yl)methyl phosphate synthase [Methylophilaceae bacterium]|nr:(5-formylfuran-3-yl)methyl phosphate synthase [Methylophilaceae bacterium]